MTDGTKTYFEEVKEAGEEYLKAKLELTKVQAFEKIARVTGVFSSLLILSLVASFTVLFLGMMIGFLLAEIFKSNAIGFSIIGILFLLFFLIIAFRRKSMLERPIVETVIKELFDEENRERLRDAIDPVKESSSEKTFDVNR